MSQVAKVVTLKTSIFFSFWMQYYFMAKYHTSLCLCILSESCLEKNSGEKYL